MLTGPLALALLQRNAKAIGILEHGKGSPCGLLLWFHDKIDPCLFERFKRALEVINDENERGLTGGGLWLMLLFAGHVSVESQRGACIVKFGPAGRRKLERQAEGVAVESGGALHIAHINDKTFRILKVDRHIKTLPFLVAVFDRT